MNRLLLAFLLMAVPVAAAAEDAVTIAQKGRRFSVPEITISRGSALIFTNEDRFIHQVYADGLFDSDERAPGQSLRETFSKTGTFEVRCHIHPKMKLLVRVN